MTAAGNQPRYRALLFDFDGTLLDSFSAHYQAFAVTMAHFGLELTPELYMQTYTPNWLAMYEALGIPESRWEEADEVWLAETRRHEPQLFPGTQPLLYALQEDYDLGLVTSGNRGRVQRDLTTTGIADYFQVLITGNDVTRPKPDPQGLQMALERLQLDPDQALYIGDAREDYLAALACGMDFLGITAEFGTVRLVEGCDLVPALTELPDYLSG